jgi:hypothetical protein
MSRKDEDLNLRESGSAKDPFRFTEIISLKYIDSQGIDKFGFITLKLEYSSPDLNYIDVEYSDPYLMKLVEEHPRILRNIDSYLRNKILQKEPTINSIQWSG